MNIEKLLIAGIVAAVICVLLRQYKPEYRLFVSLAAGIVILICAIGYVAPVIDEIKVLMPSNTSEFMEILLKALGVCYITQFAGDACRDAGETAIASKLELAGKVTLLVLALPLIKELVVTVNSLIAM